MRVQRHMTKTPMTNIHVNDNCLALVGMRYNDANGLFQYHVLAYMQHGKFFIVHITRWPITWSV